MSRFPMDPDAQEGSGLPWGVTVTPFATKDENGNSPVYGSDGHLLPRCENCWAYFNTYCELEQWAWNCSLCGTLNGLTSEAITRYSQPQSCAEMMSSFIDLELPGNFRLSMCRSLFDCWEYWGKAKKIKEKLNLVLYVLMVYEMELKDMKLDWVEDFVFSVNQKFRIQKFDFLSFPTFLGKQMDFFFFFLGFSVSLVSYAIWDWFYLLSCSGRIGGRSYAGSPSICCSHWSIL